MSLKDKVTQKLKDVIDPGTLTDIISMGLIKNLNVSKDGNVSLDFRPSSPVCPLALTLALDIQKTLKTLNEIKELNIKIIDHQMAEEVNRYLEEEGQ